jgi:hypothetical protein
MLRVRTLGTVPYDEAFALRHALAKNTGDDHLLSCLLSCRLIAGRSSPDDRKPHCSTIRPRKLRSVRVLDKIPVTGLSCGALSSLWTTSHDSDASCAT